MWNIKKGDFVPIIVHVRFCKNSQICKRAWADTRDSFIKDKLFHEDKIGQNKLIQEDES